MKLKMRDKFLSLFSTAIKSHTTSHKNRHRNSKKASFLPCTTSSPTSSSTYFNYLASTVLILVFVIILTASATSAQQQQQQRPNKESFYTRLKRQLYRQNIPAGRPLSGNLYAEHHGFPHPGRWHDNPAGIVPPNQNSGHHFESPNVIITDEDFDKYGSTLQHIDEMIHQQRLRDDTEYAREFHQKRQQNQLRQIQQGVGGGGQGQPIPYSAQIPPSQQQQQQPGPYQYQQQLQPTPFNPPQSNANAYSQQPTPLSYGPPNYIAPEPVGLTDPSAHYEPPPPLHSSEPDPHPISYHHQQQFHGQSQGPSLDPTPIAFQQPPAEYGQIEIVPQEPIHQQQHIETSGPGSGPSRPSPESIPNPEIIHHGDPNPVIPVVAHYHYNHNIGTLKGLRTVKYLPGNISPSPLPSPSPSYGPELLPPTQLYGPLNPLPQYGVFDTDNSGPAVNSGYGGTAPANFHHSPGLSPPPPLPNYPPSLPYRHRPYHHRTDTSHRLKGPYAYHIRRPPSSSSSSPGYSGNSYGGYLPVRPVRKTVKYSTRIPGAFSWSVSY